jgi:hypothetical protein
MFNYKIHGDVSGYNFDSAICRDDFRHMIFLLGVKCINNSDKRGSSYAGSQRPYP